MATSGRYGTLGLNVGAFGRWSRLGMAFLLLAPVVAQVAHDFDGSGEPAAFYGQATAYLIAIAAAYVGAYWFLGRRLLARSNAWLNTAIFVGPAFTAAWWELLIEPWAALQLPAAFVLAMGAYIGLSLLLQWRIRYGGCEVVSLPIVLTGQRHVTYCIPLVAVDAVEQQVVDRLAESHTTVPSRP